MISLAVMNQSTVVPDATITAMVPALATQWNRDLVPTWGVDQVAPVFIAKGGVPTPDEWWLVFLDDADQAGALAVHDLTNTGKPLAKVFCKVIVAAKESLSVSASHELCEMAVDPTLNFCAQGSNGRIWALEVADPVEDDQYGYMINGVLVTDFITRNWYRPSVEDGAKFSFQAHAKAPFQVLHGGYAQWLDPHRGWQQVQGHSVKASAATAVDGSRRERRERGVLVRSAAPRAWHK